MKRLRQGLLAAAVALLHVLVIQALIAARQSAPHQIADSLTWVPSASRAAKPTEVAPLESHEAVRLPNTPFQLPVPTYLPPIVIAPDNGPAQTALRDLVGCALPKNDKVWTEDRERCQDITRGLHTVAVAKRAPTEQEERLARRFKRAKAIEDAPLRAPCFNGAFFSVICLVNGFTEGFDHDE